MFKELSEKEIQEYKQYVYEDVKVNEFCQYIKLWHPICKQELINRLKEI
jgi:hypothetical protein